MRRAAVALIALLTLAGCVTFPVEKRVILGPTAEEVWTARMTFRTGRSPSFEERGSWSDQMERRISQFLAQHPEVANSYDVHVFRFDKQVAVGMTKEQVALLLGAPEALATDMKEIEKQALRYWPAMKDKVSEVWLYPNGWRVFLHENKVVDLVQFVPTRFSL